MSIVLSSLLDRCCFVSVHWLFLLLNLTRALPLKRHMWVSLVFGLNLSSCFPYVWSTSTRSLRKSHIICMRCLFRKLPSRLYQTKTQLTIKDCNHSSNGSRSTSISCHFKTRRSFSIYYIFGFSGCGRLGIPLQRNK